jgi:hypothetical protein
LSPVRADRGHVDTGILKVGKAASVVREGAASRDEGAAGDSD